MILMTLELNLVIKNIYCQQNITNKNAFIFYFQTKEIHLCQNELFLIKRNNNNHVTSINVRNFGKNK